MMALPRIVFHRDGEVSVDGVRVGTVSGQAHRWFFRRLYEGSRLMGNMEGPFKNRTPIKKRAREIYNVIEEQRSAARRAGY